MIVRAESLHLASADLPWIACGGVQVLRENPIRTEGGSRGRGELGAEPGESLLPSLLPPSSLTHTLAYQSFQDGNAS